MSISNILKKLNSRDTKLIPPFKITKKIKIVSLFAVSFLILFATHQILAATSSGQINNTDAIKKYEDKQAAISKGNNQESWMNESLMSNSMSLNQAIIGNIPNNVLEGKATSWVPGGIFGVTSQSIAYLYNPPASGVQYVAQTIDNFLGKAAYAQNTGFNSLNAILPVWKSFRNAVYVIFSIIFIGIGIAIMLRVKISPQAVITIQNSVPKLITSLILVTFSYAIAGLLIDLTYVFQGVALSILFNSKGGVSSTLFPGELINPTFSQLTNAGFWDIYGLSIKAVPVTALTTIAGIPCAIIAGLIAVFTFGAGAPVGILIGALAFILVLLIILIMILIYTIKFFFGMIKCYINIILRIILGPLEIALGAIPNMKMGFSSWMTNLIANLAVFPISLLFLVLINMIVSASTNNLWHPPMIGDSWILGPAIGLASLMILSKLPTLIPELIFQIKPSGFGKAIGEGFNDSYLGKGWSTYQKAKSEHMADQVQGGFEKFEGGIKSRAKQAEQGSSLYGRMYQRYTATKTAREAKRAEKNNPA